jgi:hypothetical protein
MGLSIITEILCLALSSLWLQSAWAFETMGMTTIYDAARSEDSSETTLDSTSTTTTTTTTQPNNNGLDPNASSVSLWEEFKPWWIALLITGGLILFGCLPVVCWRASRQRQRTEGKNKVFSLFQSLRGIDAEDLHIRHSPMGGFHVSYTNNLIHGENNTSPRSSHESSLDSGEDHFLLPSKRPFKGDEDTATTSLSLVL